VENVRDYLLGRDQRPRYLVPLKSAAAVTRQMVRWWAERWLLGRIRRDDILQRVAGHNFVHPIRHGARVPLPKLDPDQPELFDTLEH
jgi:hypothetical protein